MPVVLLHSFISYADHLALHRIMHSGLPPRALNDHHSAAQCASDADGATPARATLVPSVLATRILFCSSSLFLVAVGYAAWHHVWEIVLGSGATAATSLLNHWYVSKNVFIRNLDTVVIFLSPLPAVFHNPIWV